FLFTEVRSAHAQLVLLDLLLHPRLLLGQLLARQELLRHDLLALEDVIHVRHMNDVRNLPRLESKRDSLKLRIAQVPANRWNNAIRSRDARLDRILLRQLAERIRIAECLSTDLTRLLLRINRD